MPKLLPYFIITFINMAGFALIFPVMPEMLDYFRKAAPESGRWLDTAATMLLPARAGDEMRLVFLGGLIALGYSLTAYFAAPLWGRLSDSYGRRPIIFISTAGMLAATAVWIFYPGTGVLFFSRLAAGCFSGSLGVVTAAIADMSNEEEKAARMGYFGAALGAGMLLGPVMGGALSLIPSPFGHQFAHLAFVSCLLFFVELVLNRLWMPETLQARATEKEKLRIFPAVFSVPEKNFRLLWLVYALYCLVFSGIDFVMPYFYRLEFGLSPARIALVFLTIGTVLVAGQALLSGAAIRRLGYRKTLLLSLLVMPVPLTLVGFTPPHFFLSLCGIVPIALCGSLFMPAVPGWGTALSPANRKGYYMGLLDSGRALAFALGPVVGAVLYFFLGAQSGLIVMGVLILIAAALVHRMRE